MKRKLASLAIALGLAAGSIGAAAPAFANQGTLPSGCTLTAVAPTLSSSKLSYRGYGYCDESKHSINRHVGVLIHYWAAFPHVAVKTTSDWYGDSYNSAGSTCDGGGTDHYYTKSAYYRYAQFGGDVVRNSSIRLLTHC